MRIPAFKDRIDGLDLDRSQTGQRPRKKGGRCLATLKEGQIGDLFPGSWESGDVFLLFKVQLVD